MPSPQLPPEELTSLVLEGLRERIDRSNRSILSVERGIGQSKDYVWNRLNGRSPLEMKTLFSILRFLEISPIEFFRDILPAEPKPIRSARAKRFEKRNDE